MSETEVAASLERIERYSTWMVSDAESVRRSVRSLKYQRGFETRANATLQLAKARLESALADVSAAEQELAAKPMEAAHVG